MQPDKQTRKLTDFQEIVCNLCADMILNGGEEADVSCLLAAVIGHSIHMRFPGYDAQKRIDLDLADWLKRLARYWPAKSEPKHEQPKTVTEMLRANLRGNLEDRFRDFMARARMQELYLMNDVLGNFESEGCSVDDEDAESMLARAFLMELCTDYSYLKIPDDHVEAVEEFLKHIDEAPADDGAVRAMSAPPRRGGTTEARHAGD